jgi:hypothetical protein
MAITTTCPRCSHKNTFDDSKAAQAVHCRICHHQFALPGAAAGAAPPGKDTMKVGPPPTDSRRGDPDQRRGRDRDRDDDDRDRPSRRRRKEGSSGTIFWVLGGIGAVLVLGCCGVVSVGVLLPMLGLAMWEANGPIVVVEGPPDAFDGPPMFNQPRPPAFNQPPPPPPAPKLNPRNPADGKEALTRLKNNGPDVEEAFRWLKEADLNHPLRDEFARELDRRIDDQRREVFPNGDFLDAYFRLASSAHNFDSLMRMVQDTTFAPKENGLRQRSMETLGRLKDARAAEAITQRLANFFDRGSAMKAMEAMGPAGQSTLLKHMNDGDGDLRNSVNELLKKQNVSTDVMLSQTLIDLKSANDKVRTAACEWLSRAPLDEGRRPDVSRALNGLITAQTLEGPLFKALETWGTTENGPTIANSLDGANVFQNADRIKLLGKLKDPRTLPALAGRIGKFGFEGNAAKDALRGFGKAAEAEVVKQLLSPDMGTRHAACELLGDIGTQKVAFPAMQRAVNTYPQDRLLDLHAKNAAKKILSRGG